jgi:hypothetical protein
MKRFVVVDKEAMAQGYQEMAELNLGISNSELASEEEGWRAWYDVETKEIGGSA